MMQQHGLMQRILDKYNTNKFRCAFDPKKKSGKPSSIKLQQVSGAFIVLAVGLFIGFVTFVAEIIKRRLRDQKRKIDAVRTISLPPTISPSPPVEL